MQNAAQIKDRIISFLKLKGPSMPVQIAKSVNMSILFTSAFLSELYSERKVLMSDMKIGSSHLYLLEGQEPELEKFSTHLKSKEKEAFVLLKEKKFLKDLEVLPAIRFALRTIKDFAIPFKCNEEIFWRFFTVPESEFDEAKPVKIISELKSEVKEIEKENPIEKTKEEIFLEEKVEKSLNIFNKEPEQKHERNIKEKQKIKPKIKKSLKKTEKKNEKFFEKVKEFLSKKAIEISSVEGFSKTDLTLKVKHKKEEKLLVAFNKKKLDENDVINANKKASELKMHYILLCFGETPKKLSSLIEAVRNLEGIEVVE